MSRQLHTGYRIGIAGCGTISRIHAGVIRMAENAELVSAFSRSDEKRTNFCNKYGIHGYSDYGKFLSEQDLDVVVLCTPNGTHLDYGIPAADAGKHLIIEKPLEITTARGLQLISHCREKGTRLAVIYQNRFIEGVMNMKKAVDEGLIGDIVMARASVKWFRDQAYYTSAPWRGKLELDGGGALINQGIHTVDLLCWMAGPVVSVQAYKATLTHEGITGEDNLVAALKFKNGALGVLEASTSVIPAQNRIIEIHGTKGTATLNGDVFDLQVPDRQEPGTGESKAPKKAASGRSTGASDPMDGFTGAHHLTQYQSILGHFSAGTEPVVSGRDSLISLAVVEAAYESARSGKQVIVKDYF